MFFKSDEKYGIPLLKKEMILSSIPSPLSIWIGDRRTPNADFYLMNYGGDSHHTIDYKKTIVGFYTADVAFEKVWTNPKETALFILNKKPIGIVSPNFSMWSWMPAAMTIWNAYRSRWLARYFQESGIHVIPDINFKDELSLDYSLAGIPIGSPTCAIQIQTVLKNITEVDTRRVCLKKSIEQINPSSLLVYGSDNSYDQVVSVLRLFTELDIVRCETRSHSVRQNVFNKQEKKK
jgi:hypothetical protein